VAGWHCHSDYKSEGCLKFVASFASGFIGIKRREISFGFTIMLRRGIFFFTRVLTVLGPTHHPIWWAAGAFSRRQNGGAWSRQLIYPTVKNTWSYTSLTPYMPWFLVEQRENIILFACSLMGIATEPLEQGMWELVQSGILETCNFCVNYCL
jgi:hypothetical protein